MKKFFNLFILFVLSGFAAGGCSSDDVDENNSIFETQIETERNVFDKWLKNKFIDTYNIDYKYKLEDIEIDFTHNYVPALLENSMKLAKIVEHAWLEAYVEVAGVDFMKLNAPRILQVVGNPSWNSDGTITLGFAEGGLKISLFMANWLDETNIYKLNQYFFKTMHHEFSHILHQNRMYPMEFNLISAEDYRPSAWQNRHDMKEYAELGFITAYAGSMPREDIAELTCCYIIYTEDEWNRVLEAGGETGAAKINQKMDIVKTYMAETWNIDMDQLRDVVHRRMTEVGHLALVNPEWNYLLGNGAENVPEKDVVMHNLRENVSGYMEQVSDTPDCCHVHDANVLDLLNN